MPPASIISACRGLYVTGQLNCCAVTIRKNWLFSISPKGADASVATYSIINTAQANGMDIREYLTTIFRTGERRLPLKSE